MSPALELLHITKTFAHVTALDDVTLRLSPSAVHGVLGENGAGKSTLMNTAYGLVRPDSGEIRTSGKPARLTSPRDAIAAGVGMVHQHFMLAPAMTVLDNILLGDRRAKQWLHRRTAAAQLEQLANRIGLPINPHARVESLSVGQQQRVEILKALWRDANVLILDEPTAVLTPIETQQLFHAIDQLRTAGKAIVFISHKLAEVRQLCDRLTILRRGKVVWEGTPSGATAEDLTRHMVGENMGGTGKPSSFLGETLPQSGPILTLENLTAPGLTDISLTLAPATLLGIAGVDGNGQQELAEAILGLRPITRGRILLAGNDITRLSPKQRMNLGLAHIPNDRKREALVPTMTVAENLALKAHDHPPLSRAGLLSRRAMRHTAQELITPFDVRTNSVDAPVATLSGGNQQKVVLARELATIEPKLIVAMNPTRGLDVAATRFVHEQLLQRRQAGSAILLISSELDEILSLCDRVGVLYNARLTLTPFARTTREEIGQLMAGVTP